MMDDVDLVMVPSSMISTDFVGDVSKRLDLKNLVQVRVVLRTHHYNPSRPSRKSRV